jgi:intracellular septation protein A
MTSAQIIILIADLILVVSGIIFRKRLGKMILGDDQELQINEGVLALTFFLFIAVLNITIFDGPDLVWVEGQLTVLIGWCLKVINDKSKSNDNSSTTK